MKTVAFVPSTKSPFFWLNFLSLNLNARSKKLLLGYEQTTPIISPLLYILLHIFYKLIIVEVLSLKLEQFVTYVDL